MAFNGSGVFVRVHDWTTDLTNTVPVTASRMDAEDDGFADGLSAVICRDGQSTTTARVPFAQGLSAFGGSTSAVSYSQTNDNNTGLYFPATDQWGLVAGGTSVLNGTSSGVSVTGTFAGSGNVAINTDKFTVTASNGNFASAGDGTITGAISAATAAGAMVASQAEMETGTATNKLVTPGRAQFHPGVAKGWIRADDGGVDEASHNVSSISDGGDGQVTINWGTDFSSALYGLSGIAGLSVGARIQMVQVQAAGQVQLGTYNTAGTLTDPDNFYLAGHGDQA